MLGLRGRRRRGRRPRPERTAVEQRVAVGDAGSGAGSGGEAGVKDFGPTLLAEHLEACLGWGARPGHGSSLDGGGEPVGAEPEAGEAPVPARAAGAAGRALPVGQLDPRLAGGPRTGRPDADLDPRRRDEPAPDGAVADVVVERRLDGDVRFRVGERYLTMELLGRERPRAVPPPAKPRRARSKPATTKPGEKHPWRKRIHEEAQRAIKLRDRRLARAAAARTEAQP